MNYILTTYETKQTVLLSLKCWKSPAQTRWLTDSIDLPPWMQFIEGQKDYLDLSGTFYHELQIIENKVHFIDCGLNNNFQDRRKWFKTQFSECFLRILVMMKKWIDSGGVLMNIRGIMNDSDEKEGFAESNADLLKVRLKFFSDGRRCWLKHWFA